MKLKIQKILVYSLISGLMFRIRGGLRILFTNKKFPLCKWWFAIWFACLSCILNGWSLKHWIVMFIASKMATCICGWGEAVGCALGISKPNPNRTDYLDFDEFCDNFHIGNWKLVDHPQLFGVVWLTMRGVLLTFLIGLAANSLLYILWGAPMGLIYWFAGYINRHVRDDGKYGWYRAEWLFGAYLSLGLFTVVKIF